MSEATEEFAMPMDLSPEHSPPEFLPQAGNGSAVAMADNSLAEPELLTLTDDPEPVTEPRAVPQPEAEEPEHLRYHEHANGILYRGLTPPDFEMVVVVCDIQDETNLSQVIEEGTTFRVIRFDGNDSTVAIRPEGDCLTEDGLYWLQPEEYEVVVMDDVEATKEIAEADSESPETTTPAQEEPASETTEGLTRSQQLRIQHHEKIIARQRLVDGLLETWENAKSEAKRAKEDYENAVDDLQKLIRTPPTQPSLFEGKTAKPSPVKEATEDTEGTEKINQKPTEDYPLERTDQAQAVTVSPSDPEAWRKVPLSDLLPYGMTEAIAKKFSEGGIHTLGDASDYQAGDRGQPLTSIKGIGQNKVDKFEDASTAYFKDHPVPPAVSVETNDASDNVSTESPEPQEQPPITRIGQGGQDPNAPGVPSHAGMDTLIDHEFTREVCEKFKSHGVYHIHHAITFLQFRTDAPGVTKDEVAILRRVIDGWRNRQDEEQAS